MFNAFERAVAARYLRARKGERFVSVIALFSLIGIALGVATLIVVSSVMSGFRQDIVNRMLGVNGHAEIEAYAGEQLHDYQAIVSRLKALPQVASAMPMIQGQVLLSTDAGGSTGVLVRGMEPKDIAAMPAIGDHIIMGSLDDLKGDDTIAIGAGLAQKFRLRPGDPVTLLAKEGAATAIGVIPRVATYRVAAVFSAGLSQYDSGVVFLPLRAAQIFFQKPDGATGIEIRVHQPDQVDAIVPDLRQALNGQKAFARDWRHSNDLLLGVLRVQQDTMFIVLGLIILVAAFNVISSLIMLVKDKRRDIAILRTMGASSGAVMRIFLMCGAFIGISGTVIGTVIGIAICRNIVAIQHWIEDISGGQVFDSSVFMLTALPDTVDWAEVIKTVLLALILSVMATLYPSWRAARTDPVEALRHE
ncbi:Lipoprotein releasing system transmembrane protein lolE [Granulibacter bethesdensis]|uniref:Lipoprotein releasing system transmembrane protein lolE n=1 Tax=Granulibacter bethesdensis TaxID=364410 RepID=A0AAC9KC20_9PROT|nr:lipoprotein-releasing ABC transporter permease subunit [Granulibacter bethesdensis]APH54583.1 Lipoprotein releasing system transmembrane protein lolE [Granulibacter bethesdensis]APH62169.1 Lipoprotein releasing system transmembrane protein lolE [Granulibacter bethesdensis]